MSYIPTEWKNGDTITAEKMNNIESGISNSATGKIAVVSLSAEGFNSNSHLFGYIAWATWDGEKWVLTCNYIDDTTQIRGRSDPNINTLPPIVIPDGGTMYPFFINNYWNETEVQTTGGISTTPENVYFSWGSFFTYCYRIAGSGSIKIVNL